MRGITELLDSLTPEKRLLIIGSAFVDVIVHVPRLPLSGGSSSLAAAPTTLPTCSISSGSPSSL